MPDFRLPLSGDVIQAINPWSWAINAAGGQFGLININLGKSAAPAVEQRILEDVGSYGRQIGRIGEALEVLIEHMPAVQHHPAIKALRKQLEEVKDIKSRYPASPAARPGLGSAQVSSTGGAE